MSMCASDIINYHSQLPQHIANLVSAWLWCFPGRSQGLATGATAPAGALVLPPLFFCLPLLVCPLGYD